jgi:hypothetical protein
MQRPKKYSITAPTAASANGISTSQKPAGGGSQNLTITGSLATAGVATMGTARRVRITSDADDSARTFVLTGTDRNGSAITETITGPNATTVDSLKDFKTVTIVNVDSNTAGNITVGTSGNFSSQWFPVDRISTWDLGVSGFLKAGTATWSIEHTLDDPNPPMKVDSSQDIYLKPFQHPSLVNKTTSADGSYSVPITAVRVTFSAYSSTMSMDFWFTPGFTEGGDG